jgi:4'-phosphopantetheinyl transferase
VATVSADLTVEVVAKALWNQPGPRRPGATSVLCARSEDLLAQWAQPASLLTSVEQDRAGRFRFEYDRLDFVAAHLLARVAGAVALRVDPRELTLLQRCVECHGAHGVPFFAEEHGLKVSLAHTRGYVAAAVGWGQVGVDAERTGLASRVDDDLASAVLAPGELKLLSAAANKRHAFIKMWVRKEAMVKFGRGSLDDLSRLDLSAFPLPGPSSSNASIQRSNAYFLLEWQDPGWEAVGAAVTAHLPDLAILRSGRGGAEFEHLPVIVTPADDGR